MATTPVINNIILPLNVLLILPDSVGASTGVVVRRELSDDIPHIKEHLISYDKNGNIIYVSLLNNHVLFVNNMSEEVKIDGTKYKVVHITGIVGNIPA